MKQQWSRKWVSSSQTRKQRKYRYNAPLHVRRRFLSAHLSKELKSRYGTRSLPLRKGDTVVIARGGMRHVRGKVESVDTSNSRVSIEGIKIKKTTGAEVPRFFQASNLTIVELDTDDKKRQAILERKTKKGKTDKNGKEVKVKGKEIGIKEAMKTEKPENRKNDLTTEGTE